MIKSIAHAIMFAAKVPSGNQGKGRRSIAFNFDSSHLKVHPNGANSKANHCCLLPECFLSLSTTANTIHRAVNNTQRSAHTTVTTGDFVCLLDSGGDCDSFDDGTFLC